MSLTGARHFSDAFMAIILTVMVLELKVPHGVTGEVLVPLLPVFLSYLLSFVYLAIYWVNLHYLLQVGGRVTGAVLWANLHLLFWLSLFPFAAGWMGQNHFAALPTSVYGAVLFLAALSYLVLQHAVIAAQGEGSTLKAALGRDWKGRLSTALYPAGIAATLWRPWLGQLLFAAVAAVWLAPDQRLERSVRESSASG